MKLAKIVDNPSYVRDLSTGAVILNDSAESDKYFAARDKHVLEKRKMISLENEVTSLRRDITELGAIVRSLKNKD